MLAQRRRKNIVLEVIRFFGAGAATAYEDEVVNGDIRAIIPMSRATRFQLFQPIMGISVRRRTLRKSRKQPRQLAAAHF